MFNSTVAAIRYGYGFRPDTAAPASIDALMMQLDTPKERYTGVGFDMASVSKFLRARRVAYKEAKKLGSTKAARKASNKLIIDNQLNYAQTRLADVVKDGQEFYERLASFWTDHFAVSNRKNVPLKVNTGAFVEEAIRPHISGSFYDLLRNATFHSVMLAYLDQNSSVGPNSKGAKNQGRGLNENLGRELLELHTMGVGANYSQTDVRELAELLTGLSTNIKGMVFKENWAEPGAENVLGKLYGGQKESLDHIDAFLQDVSIHPDTAKYIARKLVTHFVSDEPPQDLVSVVADTFLQTDGDLKSVYGAMLDHPAAWQNPGQKAKQPFDFIVSGLRAFGVTADDIRGGELKSMRDLMYAPLAAMGQRYMAPNGPDGWPEEASEWITPQGLAARIEWASLAADTFGRGIEPVDFVKTALGGHASETLRWAAERAEVRKEGLILVLASPEFNTR